MAKLDEELAGRLERLARGEGLELAAIEVTGAGRRPTVRLVLDRDDGAVALDDCERVSRQASVLLDAYDPFPSSYTLEVTSPGLDRKLYRPSDYTRFAGHPVRVRMKPTWTGSRLIEGVLEGYEDGQVTVRVAGDETRAIPEREIFETRLSPFASEQRQTRRGKR